MGILKSKWMDSEERRRDALLAKVLGLTLDELDQTSWELAEINETEIEFRFTTSPAQILAKAGVEEGESNTTIGINSLSNAAYNYKYFASYLGIPYPAILFSDTEEGEQEEKENVDGIYLKFGRDTQYELLEIIKDKGLTDNYEVWVPFPE